MTKNYILIILNNFPHNDLYLENSFTGKLHEEWIWDTNKYFELECSLYNIDINKIDKDVLWPIFRIFSIIFNNIMSHLDSNDGFKILNLSTNDIYDFRERVQIVFEGFFQGKMPNQDIFEKLNPLI